MTVSFGGNVLDAQHDGGVLAAHGRSRRAGRLPPNGKPARQRSTLLRKDACARLLAVQSSLTSASMRRECNDLGHGPSVAIWGRSQQTENSRWTRTMLAEDRANESGDTVMKNRAFGTSWSKQGAVLVLALLLLNACTPDVPPVSCNDPDFQCYIDQALKGILVVRQNIGNWANVYLGAQILITLSGLVATIMIALQGDENRYWTRPTGLVATALVTGVTSALVSFHVPDTIDKLIDVVGNMSTAVNDFDYKREKLVAGRSQQEVNEAFKNDAKFRNSVNDLTTEFAVNWNRIKIDLLKLSGSASKLNSVSAPPQPAARGPEQNSK